MRRAALAFVAACATALRTTRRRAVLLSPAALSVFPLAARADPLPTDRKELYTLVVAARKQLDPVPELLQTKKWDAVRAILITPPLSDCWGKKEQGGFLRNFAAALGDSGGDELAALEAREDAMSHLRYLDMAAYNNVFSPAGGDAAVSASKQLVKDYNEVPAQELAASTKALDLLVDLGRVK